MVAALDSMCLSNKDAALILRDHAATSCTDVTGFGLLGHLLEMAQASHARAELNLDAIPTLAGAKELVKQGVLRHVLCLLSRVLCVLSPVLRVLSCVSSVLAHVFVS